MVVYSISQDSLQRFSNPWSKKVDSILITQGESHAKFQNVGEGCVIMKPAGRWLRAARRWRWISFDIREGCPGTAFVVRYLTQQRFNKRFESAGREIAIL